jgi:hypothetical protein
MAEASLYIPFITKREAGSRLIEGPVSANMVDLDGQLVDPKWLREALPPWFQFGNIREQHNSARPVGKALSLDLDTPVGPSIVAKIVDDDCWRKCEEGVFSGFSIGIRDARIVRDGRAPRGTIMGGNIFEISVVDHPSVRKAAFGLVTKAAGGWKDLQTGTTLTALAPPPEDAHLVATAHLYKHISAEERSALPDADFAGPHRSFPIADQDDVEAAAHLTGHAADPEAVKDRIIRLAKAKRLHLPPSLKDTTKMPDPTADLNEEEAPFEAMLTKSAEDKDKVRREEEARKKEDQHGSADDEEDGEDDEDYSCPRCGKDVTKCACYRDMTKAAAEADDDLTYEEEVRKVAADFAAQMGGTRPIHGGSVPKGKAEAVHAYGAMHEGPEQAHAPFDHTDAQVRLDYTIRRAEHLVKRMADALDGMNSAGFSPNGAAKPGKEMPDGDPNHGMGALPSADQSWHGHQAATVTKGVDEDTVYRIATDVATLAVAEFFRQTSQVTKGAQVDSTQAAFREIVKGVAAEVAYEAFDQLEGRLAKVENQPLPPKGFAAPPPSARALEDLTPVQKSVMEAEIQKGLASMNDEQRTLAAAQFFASQWQGAPSPFSLR